MMKFEEGLAVRRQEARRRTVPPTSLALLASTAALAVPAVAPATGPGPDAKATGSCSGNVISGGKANKGGRVPMYKISASGTTCVRAKKALKGIRVRRQPTTLGMRGWRCRSSKFLSYSCRKGPATVRFSVAW